MPRVHEIAVRGWRIGAVEPSGLSVYFDPSLESVRIFRIPSRDSDGLTAAEMCVLADSGDPEYLDKVGSVRALTETETLPLIRDEELVLEVIEDQLPLGLERGDDHGET